MGVVDGKRSELECEPAGLCTLTVRGGLARDSPPDIVYTAEIRDLDSKTVKMILSLGPSQQVADIDLEKTLIREGGFDAVDQWSSTEAQIQGRRSRIVLRKELNGFGVSLGGGCSGSEAGYYAGSGYALLDPRSTDEGIKWFQSRGLAIKKMEGNSVFGEYKNQYQVELPIGGEQETLDELFRQPWLFDGACEPMPLGPDEVFVLLKKGSVFNGVADQQTLRDKLIAILARRFPLIAINRDTLVFHRQGLSYKWKLKAPTEKLGTKEYPGYWLRTEVVFEFTKQEKDDRMEMGIPDGFLAKWRRKGVPPDGHFDHLSPEGANRLHDFRILEWLILSIADHFAAAWQGTVDSPY